MASAEQELEALVSFRWVVQNVAYVDLVSLTLLVYDHIATFPAEVKYIWPSRWGFSKIGFLVTRYICSPLLIIYCSTFILPNISYSNFCNIITRWIFWSVEITALVSEMVVLVRVSAIYGHPKWLMASLGALYLGFFVTSVTVTAKMYPFVPEDSETFAVLAILDFPGCTWPTPSSTPYAAYVFSLIYQGIVIVLTLYRTLDRRRSTSPLMLLLARDSIFYFCSTFFILLCLVIMASLKQIDPEWQGIMAIPWAVSMRIMVCRMLLSMREFYAKRPVVYSRPRRARSERQPKGLNQSSMSGDVIEMDISNSSSSGQIESKGLAV